jgi:hypothetical protein
MMGWRMALNPGSFEYFSHHNHSIRQDGLSAVEIPDSQAVSKEIR